MEIENGIKSNENIVHLNTLIENIRLGVMIIDQKDRVLLVNQLFYRIFDLNEKYPLNSKNIEEVIDLIKGKFQDEEKLKALVHSSIQSNEHIENEVLSLRSGTVIELDIIPVDADDKKLGFQWNVRDITQRHKSRVRLIQREKDYLNAIENMQLGILETDAEGNILRVNNSFCQLVGKKDEELLEVSVTEIQFDQGDVQLNDPSHLVNELNEVALKSNSEDPVWTIFCVSPFVHSNESKRYLYVFLEISKQKHLEHQLIEAKNEAENAREAEQQFLAQMSHEIRTPLNAVIGMAHLLLETQPTQEQRSYLETLNNAANILHGLISDILDISKIESGAIEVRNAPFDINKLVESIGQTFRLKSSEKPIELVLEKEEHLKNYLIGDEMLLTQILLNLVSNAFKFTEEGTIKISVEKIGQTEDLIDLKIVISDSGIGINEDNLESIFQSFRQADREIGVKYGGTGLGLSITKKLIEILDGSIKVTSVEGKGTRFELRFTFTDSQQALETHSNKPDKKKTQFDRSSRILIVEDNLMNQSYISSILANSNLELDFANNGKLGLEKASQNAYKLILMDIRMPEMDGYESSKEIKRTNGPNAFTPIIALTASAMEVEKRKAMDSGMDDFLTKPFTPQQLTDLLYKYLGGTQSTVTDDHGFSFSPIFDVDKLDELYEGDLETIHMMFESFLEDVANEVPQLRDLANQENWEELKNLSHKLLPAFAMIGLPDLHRELRKIEQACKSKQTQNLASQVESFHQRIEELMPTIQKEKDRMHSFLYA